MATFDCPGVPCKQLLSSLGALPILDKGAVSGPCRRVSTPKNSPEHLTLQCIIVNPALGEDLLSS